MNILGVGEMVLDIICVNGKIYNYIGGGSVFNVLANLSHTDHKLIAYGSVGSDKGATHALNSLDELGVDTRLLNIRKASGRKVYQNTIIENNAHIKNDGKVTCPNCKIDLWNSSLKLKNNISDDLQDKKIDIAVFDSIRKDTLDIAKTLKSKETKLFLDIGLVGNMRYMNIEKIKEHLKLPFDVIQINGKVASYIKTRLSLNNDEQLFTFLNIELLVITRREKGSTIVYRTKNDIKTALISFEISNIKDTTGAGDAFFASVILTYINSNNDINKFLVELQKTAQLLVTDALNHIGARGHLDKTIINDLFTNINDVCQLCGSSTDKKKRVISSKKFKMQTTIDSIGKRLEDSKGSDFEDKLLSIIDDIKGNVLIVGTGASYTTSLFIKECLNKYNNKLRASAIKPRDIFNENLSNINYIFLCSYSGNSPDILIIRDYIKNINPKIKVIFITQKLVGEFANNDYILSYGIKDSKKEGGFIAVACLIIPAYYFSKLFYKDIVPFEDLVDKMLLAAEQEAIETEVKLKNLLANKNKLTIDVFYDSYNYAIACDLESKFVESGAGRVTLHEKKDFSHGRFISIENNLSDLQFYIQYNVNNYEMKLVSYLEEMGGSNIIYINSNQEQAIIQTFQLLIKNQYLFNSIGKVLNTDLSRLVYNKKALKLFKYIGKMVKENQ